MKLDVKCMRYLSKDDYRVLQAVEMGMRNHELVPVPLIAQIARLKHGGAYKILSHLLRFKLVAHASNQYDGYRLSYLGYDILALRTLQARGVVASVGGQIGVGKESDVFEALDAEGAELVLKIHRLGRTSFRAVRRTRDYMADRHKASWLYMSRLAATKEAAFMRALQLRGLPVPVPIDVNRHVVAMSRVPGSPLSQLRAGALSEAAAEHFFAKAASLLTQLLRHGLVHCDLNEFNLMIDTTATTTATTTTTTTTITTTATAASEAASLSHNDSPDSFISPVGTLNSYPTAGLAVDSSGGESQYGPLTLIDFPQMVSCTHPNAEELFNRDRDGLVKYFALKMRYTPDESALPLFDEVVRESRAAGLPNAYEEIFAGSRARRAGKGNFSDGGYSASEAAKERPVDGEPLSAADDEALLSYLLSPDGGGDDEEREEREPSEEGKEDESNEVTGDLKTGLLSLAGTADEGAPSSSGSEDNDDECSSDGEEAVVAPSRRGADPMRVRNRTQR